MLFNKNIVLEIIRTHFGEEIEIQASSIVMNLESFELEGFFDLSVDYAMLDVIDEISVEDYKVETAAGICFVEGILTVLAILEGYVHWDGEEEYIGNEETPLTFMFQFTVNEDVYSDFQLDYIYG